MLKYGAKGNGATDDTAAIQTAIDAVCERGGGTVFFPYSTTGYRIESPAPETVDGIMRRIQLHIPWKTGQQTFRKCRLPQRMAVF